MITKKNSGANLERRRIAFFNIGLLGAGSLALAAFTYRAPIEHEKELAQVRSSEINYVQEFVEPKKPDPIVIKKTEVDKPKDELVTQPSLGNPSQVNEFSGETDNTQTDMTATVVISGPPGNDLEGDEIGDIEVEPLDAFPDIEASFIGGYAEMSKFIQNKLVYPELERQEGIGRKVYVYFVVEKDGSISGIRIENPEGDGLDREAKRVVQSFPKWKPGETKGRIVRTSVILPITFVSE